ncbi:MAG: hypothetical protein AB7R89_30510 [Dehalococcoidia bacterium]
MSDLAVRHGRTHGLFSRVTALAAQHALLILGITFFAVRLPFLFAGFGADTDAYRVALSGLYLWSEGEYLPSRLPGYPLHELTTALLLWGGPFLTNLSTALVSFAGLLLFDRIILSLKVPGRWWLLVAYGFTPWLLVNSTATLDYHWALTAMLAAYLALIKDRPAAAGLLLGLAAGFRITALAFALPLLVLLILQHRPDARPRLTSVATRIGIFAIATAAVTLLCYLPVLWTYGARFWNYAPTNASPDIIIQMVGQRALGVVGALVTIGVLAVSWRRLLTLPRLLRTDPHVLVWVLTIVIYTLIFLRLPVDAGYLIPIYPFAFLLVARILARWALPVIVSATLLSGVIDLTIQSIHNFSPTIAAREVRPSWKDAILWHDLRTRSRWHTFAERIGAADVPPHSVVLTLGAFPAVAVNNWNQFRYTIVDRDLGAVSMLSDNGALWDDENDIVYLAVSEPHILEQFRSEGYTIFRVEPAGPDWQVRLVPVDGE